VQDEDDRIIITEDNGGGTPLSFLRCMCVCGRAFLRHAQPHCSFPMPQGVQALYGFTNSFSPLLALAIVAICTGAE